MDAATARLACGQRERQDVFARLGVLRGLIVGCSGFCAAWTYQHHCGATDWTFPYGYVQLALSGIPRHRYLPDITLRTLHSQGQHIAWHHENFVCYLVKPFQDKST